MKNLTDPRTLAAAALAAITLIADPASADEWSQNNWGSGAATGNNSGYQTGWNVGRDGRSGADAVGTTRADLNLGGTSRAQSTNWGDSFAWAEDPNSAQAGTNGRSGADAAASDGRGPSPYAWAEAFQRGAGNTNASGGSTATFADVTGGTDAAVSVADGRNGQRSERAADAHNSSIAGSSARDERAATAGAASVSRAEAYSGGSRDHGEVSDQDDCGSCGGKG